MGLPMNFIKTSPTTVMRKVTWQEYEALYVRAKEEPA